MLDAALQARIERALAFASTDRVPTCDFLDNARVVDYFSSVPLSGVSSKIRAYHELGIDVCWRGEQRRQPRSGRFRQWLEAPLSRSVRVESLRPEEIAREAEAFRAQQRIFEPATYLAMFAEGIIRVVYDALGEERFCERMYHDPLEIERLIDVQAENLLSRAQEFCRDGGGPLFFINDSIAEGRRLLFPENFLLTQWLPRLRRALEPLKDHGAKVVLHARGNLSVLLEALIENGIDGIHPVDSDCGMDLSRLARTYHGRLLLFGGVPLHNHSPEEIHEVVCGSLSEISRQGGVFLGASKIVDSSCPLSNVLSFYTAVKEI